MGGAQRSDRQRRQQQNRSAGRAVAAARGGGSNRTVVIGVVVVIVVAAAVIGGVLLSQHRQQANQATGGGIRGDLHISDSGVPVAKVDPSNATDQLPGGGVAQVGNHNAPVTVDMYEDFICPYCDELFQQSNSDIDKALDNGQIKVRFHMLGFLDQNSNPPGYSTRAANAAMCAAEDNKFRQFYDYLYTHQPKEQSAGYSNAQLVSQGKSLGIGGNFASCVQQGKYTSQIQSGTNDAEKNTSIQPQGSFGTPTVTVDNQVIQVLGSKNWLSDIIGPKNSNS